MLDSISPVLKLWVGHLALPVARALRDSCNPMAPFYGKLIFAVNKYERWIR
jgi:hypothetical protein